MSRLSRSHCVAQDHSPCCTCLNRVITHTALIPWNFFYLIHSITSFFFFLLYKIHVYLQVNTCNSLLIETYGTFPTLTPPLLQSLTLPVSTWMPWALAYIPVNQDRQVKHCTPWSGESFYLKAISTDRLQHQQIIISIEPNPPITSPYPPDLTPWIKLWLPPPPPVKRRKYYYWKWIFIYLGKINDRCVFYVIFNQHLSTNFRGF